MQNIPTVTRTRDELDVVLTVFRRGRGVEYDHYIAGRDVSTIDGAKRTPFSHTAKNQRVPALPCPDGFRVQANPNRERLHVGRNRYGNGLRGSRAPLGDHVGVRIGGLDDLHCLGLLRLHQPDDAPLGQLDKGDITADAKNDTVNPQPIRGTTLGHDDELDPRACLEGRDRFGDDECKGMFAVFGRQYILRRNLRCNAQPDDGGAKNGCYKSAHKKIALRLCHGSEGCLGREYDAVNAAEHMTRPEHEETVFRLAAFDFPWDIERSLEFALFRTYAVPSISGLLVRTGEFETRTRKRYDDTELILSEMVENGLESERGQAALARMNAMHGAYRIANGDMLYVLSTFVCEPIRWLDRFGWRKLTERERAHIFAYYMDLGQRMGIEDLPQSLEDFERFNRAYEAEHFRYSESNARIAKATMDLLLGFYLPRALWPLGRPLLRAMMDAPLLDAMGLPRSTGWLVGLVHGALKFRAVALRVLPKRREPHLITRVRRPTYPRGYRIEELGTFPGSGTNSYRD